MKNNFWIIFFTIYFFSFLFSSEFLAIQPDSRCRGMGCVNNGIAEGAEGLNLNPCGILFTDNIDFTFSHLRWSYSGYSLSDEYAPMYEYAGLVKKIRRAAIGLNFSHFHHPTFSSDGADYSIFDGFSSLVLAADLYIFQIGIRPKIVWKVIGDYSGIAFSFDAGLSRAFNFLKLYKSTEPNFRLGLSVNNAGTGLVLISEKEEQPFNIQAGYGYYFFANRFLKALFANDYKFFLADNSYYRHFDINCGLEIRFFSVLAVNAGYIYSMPLSGSGFSATHQVSAGGSINIKIRGVNFSIMYSVLAGIPMDRYYSHAFSVVFKKLNFQQHTVK
ncbi:MAG: hypothetical protein A2096_14575 [Spirochaetes bacterium GWF1_41_5]|nr:MAG: hypothetical protein A2096_14575 [Spirochaetes bacterium GWF1_41_5]HBE01241.1 hypothetical protein [Spirochaetia bacterium]